MTKSINSISFKSHIIDAHVHSGRWYEQGKIYDYTSGIDTFTKQSLPNGDNIEKVVVSNLDCMVHTNKEDECIKFLSDELDGNRKLLELAKNNSEIIPLATCQPGYGSVENIKILLAENPKKFAGFKFHPEQLNIPADSELYNPYIELAQKEKMPCLFHSGLTYDSFLGPATKVSKPSQIYTLAKRYPDVPIIMAHLGGNEGDNTIAALDCIVKSIKNRDAKLYADISWVDCDNPNKPTLCKVIKQLIEENALDRILFGTDAPLGRFGLQGENNIQPIKAYTENINNIKAMIYREFGANADSIIEQIFYKNASNLYNNKNTILKKLFQKICLYMKIK